MRKIEIFYNPYFKSTRLFTDGEERSPKGRRVNEFIVGQPIENWLPPYVFSYQKWSGVLPELMDDLNDDELEIYFYSLPKFFQKFSEAIKNQTDAVIEKGYSTDLWKYACIENFSPQKIYQQLTEFVNDKSNSISDQYSIQLFDYVATDLKRLPPYVSNLQEIYKNLQEAITSAESNSRNSLYWKNARNELLSIFDGDN